MLKTPALARDTTGRIYRKSGLLLPSCMDLGRSVPFLRSQFFHLQNGRVGTGIVPKVVPGGGALHSDRSLVFVPKELRSAGLWWDLGCPFNRTPRKSICIARVGQFSLL